MKYADFYHIWYSLFWLTLYYFINYKCRNLSVKFVSDGSTSVVFFRCSLIIFFFEQTDHNLARDWTFFGHLTKSLMMSG